MQDRREQLDAVDDARAGPGEVGVGVERPDLVDRREGRLLEQCGALRDRAVEVVAARHEQDDLRRRVADLRPLHPSRAGTGGRQHGIGARGEQHVGDPVAAVERRIGPLQREDPATRQVGDRCPHAGDPRAEVAHDRVGGRVGTGDRAHLADARDHVVEARRVERHDVGVAAEHVERVGDRARRHCAHLAEILGEDHVGLDGADPGRVERVDRLARGDARRDRFVDLAGALRCSSTGSAVPDTMATCSAAAG